MNKWALSDDEVRHSGKFADFALFCLYMGYIWTICEAKMSDVNAKMFVPAENQHFRKLSADTNIIPMILYSPIN